MHYLKVDPRLRGDDDEDEGFFSNLSEYNSLLTGDAEPLQKCKRSAGAG
ncbi:hypothetical protein [Brenneria tiliae]|nr:hypothetical protein [Brenneria tiliae]